MREFLARMLKAGWVVPVALAMFGATPCFAQFSGPMAGGPMSSGATGSPANAAKNGGGPKGGKPEVAPPVLPGTKGASVPAEPTEPVANMTPTDALFDAINRGDLPGARDAVNRGANLDGQNLLGLTPVDLSVDLGRNDITFMLLSMRRDDTSQRSAIRGDAGQHAAVIPKATGRVRVAASAPASDSDSDYPVAAAPRLYSGNGGAPIPAAGFVGFDGGRSSR
jgi:hypothetical protein